MRGLRYRAGGALAAAVAVVALLAGYTATVAPPASAAGPLISQGRPVTASSQENAGTPAAAAVDGNPGTRWSSAFSDPQWIQVDLGATAADRPGHPDLGGRLRPVVPDPGLAPTASTWTTIYSTTTGTGGTQTLAVSGTGRYVRMNGTARATPYGYSLWEFQVFGTIGGGTGCGTANAAQGRPAHRLVAGERRHPGPARRRRQRRHPLVERVQRSTVDPGRPRRLRQRSARSC